MIWQSEFRPEEIYDTKENREVIEASKIKPRRSKLKFMVNNKLLFSLLMLSFIILSAGAVTYSWFTATASSESSKITVGTFKLSLDTNNNSNAAIFDMNNIQPGVPTDEKTITFVNTGTLDMILKAADFSLTSEDAKEPSNVGDIGAYKFIAYIYKDSDNSEPLYKPDTYVDKYGKTREIPESVDAIKNKLNSRLDNGNGSFIEFKHGDNSNGDKLICKLRLVLAEELANNAHQGDTVTGQLRIQGRQNVEGSVY